MKTELLNQLAALRNRITADIPEKKRNKLLRFASNIEQKINADDANLYREKFRIGKLEKRIEYALTPQPPLTTEKTKTNIDRLAIAIQDDINLINESLHRARGIHPLCLYQDQEQHAKFQTFQHEAEKIITALRELIERTNALETNQVNQIALAAIEAEKKQLLIQHSRLNIVTIPRIRDSDLLKKILREHPSQIESRNYQGATLLTLVAKYGRYIDQAQVLLEAGADINTRENPIIPGNDDGNTPLLWAIANANVDMALFLINNGPKYGINFELQAHHHPALHFAIAKGVMHVTNSGKRIVDGFRQIIHCLVEQGADVNAKDERNGNTPLHLAVLRRDVEVVEFLLANGADSGIINNHGQTARDMLQYDLSAARRMVERQATAYTLNNADWEARANEIRQRIKPALQEVIVERHHVTAEPKHITPVPQPVSNQAEFAIAHTIKPIKAQAIADKRPNPLLDLLGDGSCGDKQRKKKYSKLKHLLNQSSIDEKLASIESSAIKLQLIEEAHQHIISGNSSYITARYVKRHKHHALFFAKPRHDNLDLTGTQQRHLKALKKAYLSILKNGLNSSEHDALTLAAKNSELLQQNRTNYEFLMRDETRSYRAAMKIISTV